MTLYELNELLRGIPTDRLKQMELEYFDTCVSDQLGDESFRQAVEVRMVVEQIAKDEYVYRLRIR